MALLALATTLPAQTPDKPVLVTPAKKPTQTISVDSKLVNIPVVVRDNKGALVQTLTKADFTLQVDNKPQVIRYFDLDKDLPLTLGLLVDTSGSMTNVLDDERSASSAFLDQMMTSKQDQAFIIQFSRSVELLQDVTSSKPKLQAGLKDLGTSNPNDSSQGSDPNDSNSGSSSGSGQRRAHGGTELYDSVFLAGDELMSKQKGRKALVLLTDGDDRGSRERITDAIEAAQRSDTIIYAIYFKGEQPHQDNDPGNRGGGFPRGGGMGYPGGGGGYPGGGGRRGGGNPGGQTESRPDGKKILERMTHETGGRLFEVSKKQPVADIYAEIGKELRSQYRLGYTPDADAASDGYHKIDLAFTSPDKKKFTIQTREGYYTGN